MQTRSSSRLARNQSSNPSASTNQNTKGRNRRRSKQRNENLDLDDLSEPVDTMADQRTMAQLLQAPTEGYEDAIVVPAIIADNFELKHGLLTFVQNKQFFGHDKEDPHAHVRYFNKITSTLKFPNVPNTSIKLMLFPFSLEGAARIWLEKEPPRSIFTWDDLVLKFINQFFPSSKTTNLHNEITNFQQRFDESFSEAYYRSKDLLQACPHHGFSELHQLDTFYNALNSKDQDSLNSADGGNFLDGMPRECLGIIESKSKVRYSRNKPVVAKVSTTTSTSGISPDVAELKDMVRALLLDKKGQSPALMKTVEESCVTCGVNFNQGNTGYRPPMMFNHIRPPSFPPEDFSAYVKANDAVMRNMQTQGQNMQNQLTNLTDLMTKFVNSNTASTSNSGTLPSNTIANPRRDPGKFLIPCDFPGIAECLAPADLGASINLMPYSVWKRLSLSDLTPTCMTLELADRSITSPVGIAEDVYVKVGSFHFPADFVVVDFDADPRVPLILRRSFLKTRKALIDVFEGELTLRVGKEAITFNLDQTSRYSANYSDMTAKRIDIIDVACEEYSQEVLAFSDTISSGNPTPFYDPLVSTTSLTLTLFGNIDFLLEEVDAFLAVEDEPTSSEFYQPYLDPEGDILFLEALLNDDPSPPPYQGNYMPKVRKELKIYEAHSEKSSVDEPHVAELKELPPHLEYAFLEGDDKLPVIIAKDLSVEEKTALITILKSYKRAIAWKLSDIKGINPEFCTHKIIMEEDFEPAMLERLAGNQYYCFLNGFSGYFQIPIDPKDQEKTTFTCPYGTFAYLRMPFGLCNALGTFQRCEDTNLCLNWEKGHFMVKEGIVLGHKISKQGIEVDKAKVDVINKLPHSTTVKGMTRLLEKDAPFIFSPERVNAFKTLKTKLCEAPVLIDPNWDMPFKLMCDASDFAIGAVLGKRQDKHFRPIHYASKTMTEAESKYTTTEKEMLAVVYALKIFGLIEF
nr:reverse transcriptase domain-containing protein [Tanacetum cinerariifolium]